MNFAKKSGFLLLIYFIVFSPLNTEAKKRRRKRIKKRKIVKVKKVEKKKKKPFTPSEKQLISKGGLQIVHKLRELGLDAGDYFKAYKLTIGGVVSYKKGEYGDAIYLFLKGFNYVKSPTIQFWMGKTYLAFENFVKSKESYDNFLSLAKTWKLTAIKKSYIKTAVNEIVKLKRRLVALRLVCDIKGAEIAVNGEILRVQGKTVKTPYDQNIWLKPGYNYLVITKKGYVNKELIIKKGVSGEIITKKIQLLTPKQLIERSSVFKASQKAKKEQERRRKLLWKKYIKQRNGAETHAKLRKRSLRLFGYATIGGGTILVLLGGLYAILAQQSSISLEDQAEDGVKWSTLQPEYDKYSRMKNVSGIVSGIGATMIVGGILITYFGYRDPIIKIKNPLDFFVGGSKKESASLSPVIGHNQVGLSLKFKF